METQLNYQVNLVNMQELSAYQYKKKKVLQYLTASFWLFELLAIVIIFAGLFYWKFDKHMLLLQASYEAPYYTKLLGLIVLIYFIICAQKGLMKFQSSYSWIEETIQIFSAVFYSCMVTIGLLFLFKVSDVYSRSMLIVFFVVLCASSLVIRVTKRALNSVLARKGVLAKNVLIVGAGKIGQRLSEHLKSMPYSGYKVVGYLDDHKKSHDVIGKLSDLEYVIRTYRIDEIIITIPSERNFISSILTSINRLKVHVKVIPDLYDLVTTKISFEQLQNFPMVELKDNRLKVSHLFIKRLVDIILSVIGIIVLLPVYLILYILIKINMKGNVIFKQRRIGKDGRPFDIYKFRTMVENAEEILKADKALYQKYLANNYKLEPSEDPRITRLGAFLRQTSLDELPQLFNVLFGDMSLVGPRPVVEPELKEYEDRIHDFLSVKPGLTGYWQVSGRSEVGYPDRVNIELYYVYNQSLVLDFKIILKTIVSVLRREGAY